MGGGAHDLVVEQASQPPHALGEEGGELASTRSACLRPHLTQLGGFRIESKIKNILRKVGARTHEALVEAMCGALCEVTPWDVAGWFAHCGYEVEVQYL